MEGFRWQSPRMGAQDGPKDKPRDEPAEADGTLFTGGNVQPERPAALGAESTTQLRPAGKVVARPPQGVGRHILGSAPLACVVQTPSGSSDWHFGRLVDYA